MLDIFAEKERSGIAVHLLVADILVPLEEFQDRLQDMLPSPGFLAKLLLAYGICINPSDPREELWTVLRETLRYGCKEAGSNRSPVYKCNLGAENPYQVTASWV